MVTRVTDHMLYIPVALAILLAYTSSIIFAILKYTEIYGNIKHNGIT